jgi:putative hydrolase
MVRKPTFRRFRDLTPQDVNVDFQVHTVKTDGDATIGDILERARERKLGAIAFTEHVRKETDWFPEFVRDVREASQSFPEIKVFVGCETKAEDLEGTLDLTDEIYEACDIVLGSVHRFPNGHGGFLDFNAMTPKETADLEFELAMGMIREGRIHVMSHPGGMYERRHGVFPEKYFREMMLATLKSGVAIEINSSYLVDPDAFLRLLAEVNPFVSIGSDVHKLHEVAHCRDMLLKKGVGAS